MFAISRDWLSAWVGWVCRRPALVGVLALISAAGMLWYAAATLSINTSTTDMLSEELPFRQNNVAVDKAFPQRSGTLVAVIEGPDSLAAETAATGTSIIVSDGNPGAWQLYRRCGYEERGRRAMVKDDWVNPGEHWVLLVKER